MTVVYVDVEHGRVRRDAGRAPAYSAKLEAGRSRIASAAGRPCTVVTADEVSPRRLTQLAPSAMVLSGSTTDWAEYEFDSLAGLFDVIRGASTPILGICAGLQLIGYAHGARWGPLGVLQDGEIDADSRFAPGQRKERGFLPVEVDPSCLLFRDLGDHPVFFQSHYWHLEEVPIGFAVRARSRWTPIQAIERLDRPVFGVQFHPERSTEEHPAGSVLLRNFFAFTASRA